MREAASMSRDYDKTDSTSGVSGFTTCDACLTLLLAWAIIFNLQNELLSSHDTLKIKLWLHGGSNRTYATHIPQQRTSQTNVAPGRTWAIRLSDTMES